RFQHRGRRPVPRRGRSRADQPDALGSGLDGGEARRAAEPRAGHRRRPGQPDHQDLWLRRDLRRRGRDALMAVTKASFAGGQAEERQWAQDSQPAGANLGAYPDPGASAQALLTGGMVGSDAMNAAASKGLTVAEAGNGGRPGGMTPPPRSTYPVILAADNAPAAGDSARNGGAAAPG